jgi:hypothetical protein
MAQQQAQNLVIEADECVTLTPDSSRFKGIVQQYRPQTIAEVRKLLGPAPNDDGGSSGTSCCQPVLTASLPDPATLESNDSLERSNSRLQAAAAARAYVQALDVRQYKYLEPLLDRYIQLTRPILYSFLFGDIDIANGATLTLAPKAHILLAAHIRMHGTGRIVCKGPTTIRATSVEGPVRPRPFGAVASTGLSASLMSGA